MSFLDQLTRSGETMCLPVRAGNFELSIQGSKTHYCTPRITLDNPVYYSEFEVAIFEGSEWINPLYDNRFGPIKELFEDCWEHSEGCGVGGYIPREKVQILYDFCLNLESLPQAPETTEILNEVKADKGILTEEELNHCYKLVGKGDTVGLCEFADKFAIRVLDQAKGYASILSANAELSYNLKKYKTVALKFVSEKEVNRLYPYLLKEEQQ